MSNGENVHHHRKVWQGAMPLIISRLLLQYFDSDIYNVCFPWFSVACNGIRKGIKSPQADGKEAKRWAAHRIVMVSLYLHMYITMYVCISCHAFVCVSCHTFAFVTRRDV